MRFVADGPDVPEELLMARDAGEVVFLCGAGVSQARALLPNFFQLARQVIEDLGTATDSPARQLVAKTEAIEPISGVGGLVATDRIFSLLQREFLIEDVHRAVARSIQPSGEAILDAHRLVLDLATTPTNGTRVVTTNFDLLFEDARPDLRSFGPDHLPDPRAKEFQGVIHLHGKVDASYQMPEGERFIVSSADFGRAYLADGWAASFLRALMSRYHVVFVGYSADDPPVQYLLEALNLPAEGRKKSYAFQFGETSEATALWEQKGVQGIAYGVERNHSGLWSTLEAWAVRARDIDRWYAGILTTASHGPQSLPPHVRGQVAHVISTAIGARRIATSANPLPAAWLQVMDPRQRYRTPTSDFGRSEGGLWDSFDSFSLDSDTSPEPRDPANLHAKREVPEQVWDGFAENEMDRDLSNSVRGGEFRDSGSDGAAPLVPRLGNLAIWISRVAHDPQTLWWAAQQKMLHPAVRLRIKHSLEQKTELYAPNVRIGWRFLLDAWADDRNSPDFLRHEIADRASKEGWNGGLIRELASLYKPRVVVRPSSDFNPDLNDLTAEDPQIVFAHVDYEKPNLDLRVPDERLQYFIRLSCQNLELANALETETGGGIYLGTTRKTPGEPELDNDSYGVTGHVIIFQRLMSALIAYDRQAAVAEFYRWDRNDETLFARLRIWAIGQADMLSPDSAADELLGLTDRVFWGEIHERDLLFTISERWGQFSDDQRQRIEGRLMSTSYPRKELSERSAQVAADHDRLNRLFWLASEGLRSSLDRKTEIEALRGRYPEWRDEYGLEAARSTAPEVFDIVVDADPGYLNDIPLKDLLFEAKASSKFDFGQRRQREPFQGLVERRPVHALGALTISSRQNQAPAWAWSEFLNSEKRIEDSVRLITTIAGRLVRLPASEFVHIVSPVAKWMKRIHSRLYGDASEAFGPLWISLMEAMEHITPEARIRTSKHSWLDEAANAPVGGLVELLMLDPATGGVVEAAGFPERWIARVNQLMNLHADFRRQALVLLCRRLNWLFHISPGWVTERMLRFADDPGNDGDAFWAGYLSTNSPPQDSLFRALRTQLLIRSANQASRRSSVAILASFMLSGWARRLADTELLLTNQEFRDLLVRASEEFALQVLWTLKRWGLDRNAPLAESVVPFFRTVWPRQKKFRNAKFAARLVDFCVDAGDRLPEIFEQIRPFLIPIQTMPSGFYPLAQETEGGAIETFPEAFLELVCAIIGPETPRAGGFEDVVRRVTRHPGNGGDHRLPELQRWLDGAFE